MQSVNTYETSTVGQTVYSAQGDSAGPKPDVVPTLLELSLSLSLLWLHLRHMDLQGWGQIGAAAAGLCHRHSNIRSKFHLQPKPQLLATLDP